MRRRHPAGGRDRRREPGLFVVPYGARGWRAAVPRPGSARRWGHLVEGHGEQVVQHEGDSLGGSQRVEYQEQRGADRVGQERVVFGVGPVRRARDRIGQMGTQRLLASRRARTQHVEAHPRDDRCKPSTQVLDAADVGAAEPEPGFLGGIVRLAERAEHPVGHCPQAGAVGFESLRQPFVVVHRSHSLFAFRHSSDVRNRAGVTGGPALVDGVATWMLSIPFQHSHLKTPGGEQSCTRG